MAEKVSRETMLADWQWLHETGELDPNASLRSRILVAAPRMGMREDALEKALQRAGIRNPAEPGLRVDTMGQSAGCHQCRKYAAMVAWDEEGVRRLARRLAAKPSSTHLAELLQAARATLAARTAERDWHADLCDAPGVAA